jgi:2-hydroxychromene-2-carboxylate isomerase
VEGQPIGEPEIVAKALAKALGGEEKAKEIVAGTKKDEVKRLLSESTKEAFEAGVFGVPFFVTRNGEGEESVFFGVDRLGMVVELGRGKGGGVRALL